jgi:hypothetical protein
MSKVTKFSKTRTVFGLLGGAGVVLVPVSAYLCWTYGPWQTDALGWMLFFSHAPIWILAVGTLFYRAVNTY